MSDQPPPPPPPPPPPDDAPAITDFRVAPKAFEASNKVTPLERRGSRIELTLSEDARVRFRVRRKNQRPGGGKRAPTHRVFHRNLSEGPNSFEFTGYLAKRPLGPRRYVLQARATDEDGLLSPRVKTGFRIKR